ncbi:adhesion G-protein coupled receptor D2 isoform X3 [Canis lupus familiaris]|uniref:adhesion G-protein coupled receptor D2 isoform X3 n=1 Tax=Canis lupus familiaris TaxID=9615 RepID=UPI0018F4E3D1|nr:adhesion G-protein coupled receptor D2 isoform X3 [Canis lupus familiaris]
MVTVSSARRHARMLSPQPCLQEQIRIQTWATVKPVLVLLPVLGLSWLVGMLVHRSPTWAYAAVSLSSFQGPYIFLVYAAYNGEVPGALQRMTEKKATEAFTACSSPMGPGSHPRSLGPWEVAPDDPVALAPARRHLAVRGTHGPRVPTAFSSVAEPERPVRLGQGCRVLPGVGESPGTRGGPGRRGSLGDPRGPVCRFGSQVAGHWEPLGGADCALAEPEYQGCGADSIQGIRYSSHVRELPFPPWHLDTPSAPLPQDGGPGLGAQRPGLIPGGPPCGRETGRSVRLPLGGAPG